MQVAMDYKPKHDDNMHTGACYSNITHRMFVSQSAQSVVS